MGTAHTFAINDLGAYLESLQARHYKPSANPPPGKDRRVYYKIFSKALIKYYSVSVKHNGFAFPIHVRYELVNNGKPLKKLADILKSLNARYRQTLPGWKTKRRPRKDVRQKRRRERQAFLRKHQELIDCFKYEGGGRSTEGNPLYNLHMASTPNEQAICMEFV